MFNLSRQTEDETIFSDVSKKLSVQLDAPGQLFAKVTLLIHDLGYISLCVCAVSSCSDILLNVCRVQSNRQNAWKNNNNNNNMSLMSV